VSQGSCTGRITTSDRKGRAAPNKLLKNARLLRFPHPSPFNVPESTPHGSGFRGPCIRTFLNSLNHRLFQQPLKPLHPCWFP
jgi:hypothetical protein